MLPEHELRAHIERIGDLKFDHRMAFATRRSRERGERGVRTVPHHDHHAVVAKTGRRRGLVVEHRNDPHSVFAGRFGYQLFDPQPEGFETR